MPANRENVDAAKDGSTGGSREAGKTHRDRVRDLINDVREVGKPRLGFHRTCPRRASALPR